MEKIFYKTLTQLVNHPERQRFLLAVSGGKDSMALLHLFAHHSLNICLAHCNFHLRGQESDEDMNFVKLLAEKYSCHCLIKEFFEDDFSQRQGQSIEMIARDLRYEWFSEVSKQFDYIVTAHHANDNAETLLLNLARGCGLRGMKGIPPHREKIIRPLLAFSAEEITTYLKNNHLTYRIDVSNWDTVYRRNLIRHRVLPELQKINSSLIATFTQNVHIFSQQYKFYDFYMQNTKNKYIAEREDDILVDFEALKRNQFIALILYEILSNFGFSAAVAMNILTHPHVGNYYYSDNYKLLLARKHLVITKKNMEKKLVNKTYLVQDESVLKALGFSIELHEYSSTLLFEKKSHVFYADADKLRFPLTIRHWKKGDYFYPLGMKGKKKMSDWFTDNKIDSNRKEDIELLCCGENIAWVVGFRTDDRYKIDEQTRHYYKIIKNIDSYTSIQIQ